MNPPPIIIIIIRLEATFVFSFNPAIPRVKMQGHNVEQKRPTEINANTLIIPELKIPKIRAEIPRNEYTTI